MIGRKAVTAGLLGIAAIAAPSIGLAQARDAGAYIGASFGQATADDFCDAPSVFTVGGCDDEASAWKLFGGYQVNRNFALELSYIKTDDFSIQLSRGGVTANATVDATAYGIAALGMWPATERFALFGKLGIIRTDAEGRASIGAASVDVGEDETGLHYGIGVLFHFTPNLGLRGEWEKADKGEFSLLSVGLQYRF